MTSSPFVTEVITSIQHDITSGQLRLPVLPDVAMRVRESDADQSNNSYNLWRLNMQAELPGTNLDRDFEIPVYATGC